jgi:uncharacterized SAM-binding protein YcdF (DUF218 family)/glycopeptide antibiotics resistance protein
VTGTSISALLAVFLGVLMLPVLFIPYVAWSYRSRRTLGLGYAAITATAVVYGMALWTYTILPLPDSATMSCTPGIRNQFIPLAALGDINLTANGLTDPALLQLVANVALFVPFGMLVRHLTTLRAGWVVVAGLGVSLLIELTQLTGVWGLYPCAYRIFDVDDLLTNTIGAGIGVALAPILRRVPGQEVIPTDEPRVVRPARRLIGMAVDLMAVQLVAFAVHLAVALIGRQTGWLSEDVNLEALGGWILLGTALVFQLGVPWFARGATLGQLLVLVRPVDQYDQPPGSKAKLIRWVVGSGGYFTLSALAGITGVDVLETIATAWLVLTGVVVLFRHPRGISGYAAGLTVADARDPIPGYSEANAVDPRSLGVGVVALLTAIYLGITALTAISSLAPWVGLGIGVLGVGALVLVSLALVPALIANGLVMLRKEGRGVGSVLMLLAAAGIVGLFALLVLAVVTGWVWLLALTLGALAVTSYLGFLFLAFLLYGQWYGRQRPTGRADAVVVLGSRVYGDRVPPLLAARIDRGIEVFNDLRDRYPGADIKLICSGGQGADEVMSEGEAMARYAVAQGVPEDLVLAETQSRNTRENLTLSRELLEQQGSGTAMVVSTNNFHALRAAIIARELGLDARVVGAATARYYFPSAVMRDFVGVLARQPLLHGVVAVVLALVVGGLTALLTA